MVVCAYSHCENEFEPNVQKRQKYCSSECSVRANNEKAMREYHERKRVMEDPNRKCQTVGCPTILRRTNTGKYCDACKGARKESEKRSFRNLVLGS